MVFPSAVINIASGMVFDFPLSAFISGFGIFVEFMVMFLIGRFLGNDYIQTISDDESSDKVDDEEDLSIFEDEI